MTDFEFYEKVSLARLLANLPEGVVEAEVPPHIGKEWVDREGKKRVLRILQGPSFRENDTCFLHVHAEKDGDVDCFVRYGRNKPTRMLRLIAEKLGVGLKDEAGFDVNESYFLDANG